MRTGTPKSKLEWIAEISEAYRDAEEAIPFGAVTAQPIKEKDLFHLAPAVCLKFRGVKRIPRMDKRTVMVFERFLRTFEGCREAILEI